jgi:hypothetical protein|tara:strand:+ start:319 stop:423 length:105 start_codon:yes stop_codon:yes gene_type:complete
VVAEVALEVARDLQIMELVVLEKEVLVYLGCLLV